MVVVSLAVAATVLVSALALLILKSSSSLRALGRCACDVRSWAARLRWAMLPSPGEEDTAAYNTGNHRHITELHEAFGDAFSVKRNGKDVLFVRAPGAIRAVLLSDAFGKAWATDGTGSNDLQSSVGSYVHNLVQPLLSDSVFSNKGSQNGDARAMLQKTFTGSPVFRKGFAAEIGTELASWKVDATVDCLDLSHSLIRSALYHAIAGDFTECMHALTPVFHECLDHFVHRYAVPCHDPALSAKDEEMLTKLGAAAKDTVVAFRVHREAQAQAQAEAQTKAATSGSSTQATLPTAPSSTCIADQAALHAGEAEPAGAEPPGAVPGARVHRHANASCMLHHLVEGGCSDAQAAAVIVNTVIAGAEAPASALAHTLCELARNKPVQAALRAEVLALTKQGSEPGKASLGEGASTGKASTGADSDLISEHLHALPRTKEAVLEGLRLFAPATLVKRQALVDVAVAGVGLVPKGTVVELCVTAIHADKKQFSDPATFSPAREGPVLAGVLGKERCFMPFSGGPRGCPGRYVAVTMLHVALASIVQRFEIEPASHPALPAEFSNATGASDEAERVRKFALWPKAGLPLMLRPATGMIR